MSEPQLSVRSARARDLAHRLARREQRTIAEIVERALEAYAIRQEGGEPASAFYLRLAAPTEADDIDIDALVRAARKPDPGPDL